MKRVLHRDPLRWAHAIIRLAALRRHCTLTVAGEGEETRLEVFFPEAGPHCRCCQKPLDRHNWLRILAGGFEKELTQLVVSESL